MAQQQQSKSQQRREEVQQPQRPEHDALTKMFNRIAAELKRAREKHGDQDHLPILGGIDKNAAQAFHAKQEANWKRWNDDRSDNELLGWDGIVMEEIHEAFAAESVEEQIEELVQSAAMCVRTALILQDRQ